MKYGETKYVVILMDIQFVGQGVDLTAAHHAIFLDGISPVWKANQCLSCVHRITQNAKEVDVTFLTSEHSKSSVEEDIFDMATNWGLTFP